MRSRLVLLILRRTHSRTSLASTTTTTGAGSSTVSLSRFMSHFVRPRKRNAYSCGFAENIYRRERHSNGRFGQHQWCSWALGDALCVGASGCGGGGARWGGSRSVNVAHGGRAAIHTWIDFILDVSYGMDRTISDITFRRSCIPIPVLLFVPLSFSRTERPIRSCFRCISQDLELLNQSPPLPLVELRPSSFSL